MIYNRPRRRKKKPDGRTWYFKDTIKIWFNTSYVGRFSCSGRNFSTIGLNASTDAMSYVSDKTVTVYLKGVWQAEEYRTIVFEKPPTGDLLAFLEANATPQ